MANLSKLNILKKSNLTRLIIIWGHSPFIPDFGGHSPFIADFGGGGHSPFIADFGGLA